jgi:predicted transcriptional regulator
LNSLDEDWWDLIDEEEKKAIDEGLAQLNSGNTIPHKEVVKKARQKFNIQ